MKKRLVLKIFSVVGIALLSVAGYYGYHVYQFMNKIHAKPTAHDATETWTGGRVNILLMGGDARPGETSDNSDSMILLSMDPDTHKAQLFSIMRDTWWKIPGYSYQKINAGNLIGGPELAVQTVENFLDIPINYYVETNFTGFQKIVDILGGVDMNVDETMNYDDPTDGTSIHLKQGEQHLNGKQALDFARFRHDAMGDFNRTKRQRELLQALALKADSTYGLVKLPQLLDALAPYVQTNMDATDMIKLATLMHGTQLSNIQLAQVPPMDDLLQRYLPEGGDVLIPNVLATREFVHQALGMTDTVTATAEEQSYWDMYQNGGSQAEQTASSSSQTVAAPHTSSSVPVNPVPTNPSPNPSVPSVPKQPSQQPTNSASTQSTAPVLSKSIQPTTPSGGSTISSSPKSTDGSAGSGSSSTTSSGNSNPASASSPTQMTGANAGSSTGTGSSSSSLQSGKAHN